MENMVQKEYRLHLASLQKIRNIAGKYTPINPYIPLYTPIYPYIPLYTHIQVRMIRLTCRRFVSSVIRAAERARYSDRSPGCTFQ